MTDVSGVGTPVADDDEPDCADIAAALPADGATPAEMVENAKRSLRELYGTRLNLWGDLSSRETRWLYHQLLPRVLVPGDAADDDARDEIARAVSLSAKAPLEERARVASAARHAAKLYVRERSILPVRAAVAVYATLVHLQRTGTWSWGGMSPDEVWRKYEKEIAREFPALDEAERTRLVCERVLSKATKTDPRIDKLAGIRKAPRVRRAWSLLLLLRALPFRREQPADAADHDAHPPV